MMTSPVGHIYLSMLGAVSRRNEAAMFINEAQKRELLRGVFRNYYEPIAPGKVVFDTNRMWCTKLPNLADHFPNAKVICCVRNISWIMDSIERLVRRNIFDPSGIFGFETAGTVYTRVNRLAANDGMVGFALDALREAYFGEHADRLILVSYQALTRAPRDTLALLYDFIGEPRFEHDFENVEYEANEFDLPIGSPGLHTVRRRVEFIDRQTILPVELFQRFENDAFWMNPDLNIRNVPVILPVEAA
jgi:sulfotransferase